MSERRPALTRSGSQNRKRSHKRSTALTDEEAKAFDALVDRAGTTASDLIRSAVFAIPVSRARRRPTINEKLAGRLLGALQENTEAFRQAHEAAPDKGKYDALFQAGCRDQAAMVSVWFEAMGRKQ